MHLEPYLFLQHCLLTSTLEFKVHRHAGLESLKPAVQQRIIINDHMQ